jgi:hypothetical protein
MSPVVFATSAAATTQVLAAAHLWGIPDWPAGILMIAGLIFLFGILPPVVLCALVFECRRRRGRPENNQA